MTKTNTFTSGPVFGPLVRFAMPVLLALFLQALYGAADLFIAGQFGGVHANEYVSAISTGSQLMQSMTTLITGLAMGLTVALANAIGAGHDKEAAEYMGSGIILFTGLSLLFALGIFLYSEKLSLLLSVPVEAFDSCVTYIRICSIGLIFIVFYNLLGSIFRGIGDSVLPLITVAIAAALNIVLDYVLIAIFSMGTAGAAIATVGAQALSVLLSLWIIARGRLPFAFGRKDIRWKRDKVQKILQLGVPLALQDFLVSISFLIILMIVNSLGLVVSAAVGVAGKVTAFILLVPSAYMQSMAAFVGQNIGAGKPERARKALYYGILSSLLVGAVMAFYSFFFGDSLAAVFTSDPETIARAFEYLRAFSIDCLLTPFFFCFIGYFNGCEKTTFVMAQGIIGSVFVRVPCTWLFSRMRPVNLFLLGMATPIASMVQIILGLGYFFWISRLAGNHNKYQQSI